MFLVAQKWVDVREVVIQVVGPAGSGEPNNTIRTLQRHQVVANQETIQVEELGRGLKDLQFVGVVWAHGNIGGHVQRVRTLENGRQTLAKGRAISTRKT